MRVREAAAQQIGERIAVLDLADLQLRELRRESAAIQFVFCDGSARLISFDIEPRIHRLLANRQDRELFDERGLE